MIQLSQKERMILQDQKSQEEICVVKYQNYSQQVQDQQLKQLLSSLATEEKHHYDMVNQMLSGQEPNMSHPWQQQGSQQANQQTGNQMNQPQGMQGNANDKILCSDLLSTEKYVSGTYDTGIFESANPSVRKALQHIQQDEQRHGEMLFQYMNTHGMYNVQ